MLNSNAQHHLDGDVEATDIVIIGGGMVGLSLALMLAQQNLAVNITVFDEHPFKSTGAGHAQPSFDRRATAISAGSARLLSQLGLWSELVSQAQSIDTVKVSDQSRLGFTAYNGHDNGHQPLGFVIENHELGQCLKAAVDDHPAIQIYASAEVLNVQPRIEGAGINVRVDGGVRHYQAPLLILADGAASPLARQLGIGFNEHQYKQHALITSVAHSEPHRGCAFEHFTEAGPVAFLPLPDAEGKHRSAVVWTHANEHIEAIKQCSELEFLSRLQAVMGYRLGRLSHCGKRDSYSLNLVFAKEQYRRGMVLMGNAAHFLHPVAGQGFNLAMRDCAELAVQLKRGQQGGRTLGDIDDLSAYIERRETDQWLTTELSHHFIDWFTSTSPLKRVLRTTGLSILNKTPTLKSFFFQQMMGQGVQGVNLHSEPSHKNTMKVWPSVDEAVVNKGHSL